MKRLFLAALLLAASFGAQAQYREFEIVGPGSRTTTATSSAFDTLADQIQFRHSKARILVNVTAVSGTSPSMTPELWCAIGATLYRIAQGTAITATGQYTFEADVPCKNVRGGWTMTGTTPSFTFSMTMVRN